MARTWEYPSSSGPGTYTVTHADNGLLGCTCKGWTMKKPGKPRECRHITDVIDTYGLAVELRGDYVFSGTKTDHLTEPLKGNIIIGNGKAPADTEMATMATTTVTEGMTAPAAQLASGMTQPVTGDAFNAKYSDGWMMDEKLDGHRCVVVKRGDRVVGWSRGGDKANAKSLPQQIVDGLLQMPDGIYDGELVVPGGNSWNVTELTQQGQLVLILFDILEVLGENVTTQPQSMRRQLLTAAIGPVTNSSVMLVAEFKPDWAVIEKLIWKRGGEGVILKKQSATYRPGYRSDAWIKVKQLHSLVGVVTGFDAGSFGPHAVTCLTLDSGVQARVKTKDNYWLAEIAKDPQSFIGRRLVISCQQLTPNGSPRHPMFDHWAGDAE